MGYSPWGCKESDTTEATLACLHALSVFTFLPFDQDLSLKASLMQHQVVLAENFLSVSLSTEKDLS